MGGHDDSIHKRYHHFGSANRAQDSGIHGKVQHTHSLLHWFRFYKRFARLATHGVPMAPSPKPENFYWVCNQQRKPARRPTRVPAELGHAEYRKTKISSFSSWCQFRERFAATLPNLAWLVDRKGR